MLYVMIGRQPGSKLSSSSAASDVYKRQIGWSVNQYGFEDAFVLAVLSRELESVDRDKLVATHKRITGKARYKKILDQLELVYE